MLRSATKAPSVQCALSGSVPKRMSAARNSAECFCSSVTNNRSAQS
jgi:hypothetical protein